jgi:hypothetical protein
MTFITHGFRVSVVSDVRERVRDFRITFALLCERQRALYGIKCVLRIFGQTWLYIIEEKKIDAL